MKTLKILFVVGMIVLAISIIAAHAPATQAPSPEQTKLNPEEYLVSVGMRQVRNVIRDPDSFQITDAVVVPDGIGCIDYRYRNGVDSMNAGKAVVLPDGTVRIQEQDGDTFVTLWNKECAGVAGKDVTSSVQTALGVLK